MQTVETFTPLASLLGGLLVGLAAVALMAAHGRVLGISGIWFGIGRREPGDTLWRLVFVAGLVAGGLLIVLLAPEQVENTAPRSVGATALAGLLVGLGTRLGSGCTSGHGVCGIGRLSPRSLVATVTFVLTGAISAWVGQHLLGGAL